MRSALSSFLFEIYVLDSVDTSGLCGIYQVDLVAYWADFFVVRRVLYEVGMASLDPAPADGTVFSVFTLTNQNVALQTLIFCVCGQAVPSPPDYIFAASELEAGFQPTFKLASICTEGLSIHYLR